MKKTRIVFFDIDHTIYDPYKKIIPASTIEAIKKLKARNDTYVAIATGRAFYMCDILEPIKKYIDIYITINGQIIIKDLKVIKDFPLEEKTVNDIKRVFDEALLSYGYIGKDEQAINKMTDYARCMFNKASMPLPKEDPNFNDHHAVYQMWAFAKDEMLDQLKGKLKAYQVVPWVSDGFDIVHTDKSKWDGIQVVLETFDIKKENVVCFGDGDNDLQMLKYLPNSYAMGNAKPHIKAVANYSTEAFDEHGIYNALKAMKWID